MSLTILLLAFVCQIVSACRSTNQLLSVCLYKISLTPQHASSWGCGEEGASDLGNQAEEEHTTAACWNNKSDWNDCSTWVMLPSRAFNRTTWLQREKISAEYGRPIAYHIWKEVLTEAVSPVFVCFMHCKLQGLVCSVHPKVWQITVYS